MSQAFPLPSQAALRLLSLSGDYLYVLRPDTDPMSEYVWTNYDTLLFTGYTTAELNAKGGWTSIVHQDAQTRVRDAYTQVQSGRPAACEFRLTTKDGVVRTLRSRMYPLLAPDGSVEYICGAARDVTQQ